MNFDNEMGKGWQNSSGTIGYHHMWVDRKALRLLERNAPQWNIL
jgi:hypothetical protein